MAILALGGLFVFGQFALTLAAKQEAYEQYENGKQFIALSTDNLRGELPQMDYLRWQNSQDASTLVKATLDRILKESRPGSLIRESVSVTPSANFLGFLPEFSVHEVEVALSGNFSGLQKALLTLETMLPNLFLTEMSLDYREPDSGMGKEKEHIFARAKYTMIGSNPSKSPQP
jgi:hypothetical protein